MHTYETIYIYAAAREDGEKGEKMGGGGWEDWREG